MEVWRQTVKEVATIAPQKRETKDFTLRVRLNPIEKHELNEAMHNLNFTMSATVICLIKAHNDIMKAKEIIAAYGKYRRSEKEFEALIQPTE